ncbi:MAG: hypothetical protein IKV67_06140 [Paludibacteraceae bacterium]|nr:hypothetical protein [Paludibacteraceae bacterium]
MRNLFLFVMMLLTVGVSAQSKKHRQMFDEMAQICRLNDKFMLCDSIIKKTDYAKSTRDSINKYKVENLIDKFSIKDLQNTAYLQFKNISEADMVEIRAMLSNPALADAMDVYSIGIVNSGSKKLTEILDKLRNDLNTEIPSYGNYSVENLRKAAKFSQLFEKLDKIGGEAATTVESWGGYSSSELKKAADDMKTLINQKRSFLEALRKASSNVVDEEMMKLFNAQDNLLKSKGVAYRIR